MVRAHCPCIFFGEFKSILPKVARSSKMSQIILGRTVLNLEPAWTADICVQPKHKTNIQISLTKGTKE